jgi:NAD(P)-dependent dehydrogenase (short-subunit alcohol dehydrogenase family)
MSGRLEGKVAIVTGSGSGIGQAIAERLAQEGADCVVDYRDHIDQAQATVDKITAAGGKSIMVHADVSNLLIPKIWSNRPMPNSDDATSWSTTPASRRAPTSGRSRRPTTTPC